MGIFDKFKHKTNQDLVELETNKNEEVDTQIPCETINNDGKDPQVAQCLQELDNAYREIDYLTAKCNYFEALYNYTKLINDPNSGNANKAYVIYENVKRWEKIYKKFEES